MVAGRDMCGVTAAGLVSRKSLDTWSVILARAGMTTVGRERCNISPIGVCEQDSTPVLSQPRHGSVTLSEAKGLHHVGGEILHLHYVPVQNDITMKLTEYWYLVLEIPVRIIRSP
jgi:hypothetical protein